MDFGLLKKFTLAAFPAISLALLVGCSSSEGFVDYADIPAPSATESDESEPAAPEPVVGAETPKTKTADAEASDSETPDRVAKPERSGDAETEAVSDAKPKSPTPMADSNAVVAVSKTAPGDEQPEVATEADNQPKPTAAAQDAVSADPAEISDSTKTVAADATDAGKAAEESSSEPRQIELLIPEKRFRSEGDSKALRVSYDDIDLLKVLNMEPVPPDAVEHFPRWLKDLDGKRVRLRGFMYPTFVASGITQFGLARDNGICCFVKQPKIYDMFSVSLADGETTDYIENKPFDVEGIFRIVPEVEDGELYELYRVEDAIVLK